MIRNDEKSTKYMFDPARLTDICHIDSEDAWDA